MTTLLIVLAMFFMQHNTERTTGPTLHPQGFPSEKPIDNQAIAQATKPTTRDFLSLKNLESQATATQNLKSLPTEQVGDFLNLIAEIKPNQDSSFYQKLFSALSQHTQALSPEKVYLQFDRLFFEPGEDIWFNAFVRDANTLKASPKSDILYVELLAPNGSVLKKINLLAKGGTTAGDFKLDANAPGGLYKIRAYTNWMRNANDAFERDLQVQATVLPRLRMELDFMKKAYGPGDVVEAKIDLNTLANAPLANDDFSAKASLDGQQFTEVAGKTDGRGHAQVKFELPKGLVTNDGLLNVLIQYNGQTESISRSIPIVLNKVDLQFMPEGGDMVAGLPATVAFKALNEWGKPADIAGKIVNSKGVEVARFESYHQGMGAFNFTPASGESYHAILTKPDGIAEKYGLMDAFPRGFSMKINPLQKDELTVEVNSTEDEALHVALVSRGEVKYMQTLPARAGSHLVRIPVKSLPIGIAQVTLFDSQELPRAERLVFLNHDKQLKINVKTDKEKYLPREKVTMTVSVTDERGIPMPGQFSLAVADDNLLTFADDKQGHILSHLLLESELKGKVEEPNFYFEPKEKHPEKNELLALDYLMMTQGWRRLAWEELLGNQPVAMQFEGERAVTQGIVTDKNGNPVPRMLVGVKNSNIVALTDNLGHFELDTLIPFGQPMAVYSTTLKDQNLLSNGSGKELHIQLPYDVSQNKLNKLTPLVLSEPKMQAGPGVVSSVFDLSVPMGTRMEGTIKDADSAEPIAIATVALFRNGVLVTGTETDFDGYYSITELDPGTYDVEFSTTGYSPQRVTGVPVRGGKGNNLNVRMSAGVELTTVEVKYSSPLIEQDNTTSGSSLKMDQVRSLPARPSKKQPEVNTKIKGHLAGEATTKTLTSEQIKQLPTRDVNALASYTAGVSSADEGGELNIRGSRSDAANYYIDGIRVTGSAPPKQAIEEAEFIQLGVPAPFAKADDAWGNEMQLQKDRRAENPLAMSKAKANMPAAAKPAPSPAPTGLSFYAPRQFYAPKYDDQSAIRNPQSLPTGQAGAIRDDFRKTVFFAPKLDVGRNGRATVEFYNTDAISTFRATVEGIATGGGIGRNEQRFFTQMPFSMDVKVPVNLLTGDKLAFPLALTNNTGKPLSGKLTITMPRGFCNTDCQSVLPKLDKNWQLVSTDNAGSTVWQTVLQGSTTIYPEYEIALGAMSGEMKVEFEANGTSDAFTQALKVQPRGFPVDLVFGGNERDKTFSVPVKDVVEGSLSASFTVHPSVLSDLTTGMERMLGQPSGCFEQTSSTNYPNILVLNLLKTTGNANPALESKANGFLDYGYKRLKTFEIKGGGFDWFASPPAHEALSAYGLMEFVDMKSVYPVEQDLIDRTANWLLTRRDGKGGWLASKQGLHSWQQPNPVSDAYITWAMTEAGYGKQVGAEIAKQVKDARETQDPYIVALAAKSLLNLGDRRAEEMLAVLTKSQAADGSWTGKTMSMTHSTGKNLTVETTALATLAFLSNADAAEGGASGAEMAITEKAVRYLAGAKTQYGFGSTQATVLALKALVANAKNLKKNIGGEVELFVNGKSVGKRPFTADERNALVFKNLEQYFTEGKNEVKVKFANGDPLPYDLSVKYSTTLPYSNPDCKLSLKTALSDELRVASLGDTKRLTTTITNRSKEAVPNPICIVGIPAGLSLQPWQLKQMQERGVMDFYEIKDSYVVFYFRGMGAGEVKDLHLDLKADVPGEYEAPASAAWLYYSNDAVVWSKPERVEIGKLGN
ncbi:MAG: carboxypeptidase regulatory-like domain-containing protein [Saprospiraceae bacterium]|nr:carboxypeptidase regulatory-like domain-containing protein [Saprospiraceae bacterium]